MLNYRNKVIWSFTLFLSTTAFFGFAFIRPAQANVINLTNWKLTLPIGTDENPLEVTSPELVGYQHEPYFVVAETGIRFRAPTNGVTTEGSAYPRSELREMTNNGKTEAAWSSVSGRHSMIIEQAITALPETKAHVVAGQIHDDNDDVITIRLEDHTLFIEIDGEAGPVLDADYELGRRFTIEFVVVNGIISVYYNKNVAPAYTFSQEASDLYFKAGAYTQSNCDTENNCGEENYGEVFIYKLNVTHRSEASQVGAVKKIRLSDIKPKTVTVRWRTNKEAVARYTLQLWNKKISHYKKIRTLKTAYSHTNLKHLKERTSYKIRLRATVGNEPGRWSSWKYFTTR